MALDLNIIKDGFLDLQSDPPANEAAAIPRMATILMDYFKTAAAGAATITGSAVDAQQATIEGALVGMKAAGPAKIQAACLAFWGVVVLNPAPFFAGHATPAVISPTLSTIAALMLAQVPINIGPPAKTPAVACLNMATAIHQGHIGTPTTITLTSGPTVVPIT